jgi:hypothetical protein
LDFEKLNWLNQGLNYEKIKILYLIRGLIEEIQVQGPTCKWYAILGVEIGEIKDRIEEN